VSNTFDINDAAGEAAKQWTFKRNCSVTPKQVAAFYLPLAFVSFTIATGFWLQGIRFVMPFAWLEMAALGTALLVFARHASDKEELLLTAEKLEVRWFVGARLQTLASPPHSVRIEQLGKDGRGLVSLSSQGQRIDIGRYVRPERRAGLARELKQALLHARDTPRDECP
jgi:uncharacterized membrane protein